MQNDITKSYRGFLRVLIWFVFSLCFYTSYAKTQTDTLRHSYFFSVAGNDNNEGTKENPFHSLAMIVQLQLKAGDTIFLRGGNVFSGTLRLPPNTYGSVEAPVVITSYGSGKPTINGGDSSAVVINNCSGVRIQNLICEGNGRKEGNTKVGMAINDCHDISIDNIEVYGFQKAGLQVYNSHQVSISHVYAHDNGFAGIHVIGNGAKDSCTNITITHCKAENNPGDPTEFNNHSGNGILAGFCRKVLIDHCSATNNGWDMPRVGNGPVGIWCYEADSVIIQHCISYLNKTSKGGEDGGGYDFDGGVTNSVIQYCLSYGNQGSAFGIFQYDGASPWHDNVIRFCISENDGNVSAAHGNVYVWNSSHDSMQFSNLLFYNNTIYNHTGSAISYSSESEHRNFRFCNNIFVVANGLLAGATTDSADIFLANNWWSLPSGFRVRDNTHFRSWVRISGKEQWNGKITGLNIKPPFKNADSTTLSDADKIQLYDKYKLIGNSPLKQAGFDLQKVFGIETGKEDFNGKPVNRKCIGAITN